jgi:CRP-like cAMP-binding protein
MSAAPPERNAILRRLSDPARRALVDRAVVREYQVKHVLGRPGQEIDSVYFPLDAMISLVTLLDSGDGVELATIGYEGALVPEVLRGDDRRLNPLEEANIQLPGHLLEVQIDRYERARASHPELERTVRRYARAYSSQVAVQVACNALHSIEERCARWLLLAHDRTEGDHFPLTHELLSKMLGVRRASVTVAAGVFHRAGFIDYSRGQVTVLDRHGLEESTCECYGVVSRVFEELHVGGRG